jgi:hypothetical protein
MTKEQRIDHPSESVANGDERTAGVPMASAVAQGDDAIAELFRLVREAGLVMTLHGAPVSETDLFARVAAFLGDDKSA